MPQQDKPVAPEVARDNRMQELHTFAETMHAAHLPEPFAGAVLQAVKGWNRTIDAALWAEVRADYARNEADAARDELEAIVNADNSHPHIAALVERVTERAFTKVVALMAAKAGVSETVMAATIGALSGEPVPPSLADEVFNLLANAAEPLTNDHEQAS